ncbi:PREDICTED: uncharacterized protein LOC100637998 [Amphimedon queenslandica]|uniref:EF-hand domain-containing protein n=1 Tax=Amphimedon queenslandica TaxID=400682 RepID=A0A1X7VB10_AMPQE|nr:PREDICTED: uncharacterized protein LOC100637998 [Amphimedon queenslandica]|eukprot:XP_011402635.2 PREDICTED: uncharacterized protein LOC100637998 [Amphimedon queenslandica]
MPEETNEPSSHGATPKHQGERHKAIQPAKTCPKCEDFVKNGSSIHWTLAYRRCRCHRSWKYSLPEETLSFDTRCVSAMKRSASFNAYKPGQSLLIPRKQGKGTLATPWLSTAAAASPAATGRKNMLIKRFTMPNNPHLPPLASSVKLNSVKVRDKVNASKSRDENNHTVLQSNGGVEPLASNSSSSSSHKQVSFCVVDSPTHHTSSNNAGRVVAMKKDKLETQSSIPSLPQIQSNCGLIQSILTNGGATTVSSSTDSESEEGTGGAKTTSVLVAKKPGRFEFINLLKCVQNQTKLLGSDLFDLLDTNDDGHLSFAETMSGLTKSWQNSSAILKLEYHLKPLYHMLGDDTYFGKRDFILCFAIAQIFKENNSSIPYLSNVDTQFYCKTVKLLMEMITECKEIDVHARVSIPEIESSVKKLGGKISFNIATALKLKRHVEGFTYLELLLFCPYLLTIHK